MIVLAHNFLWVYREPRAIKEESAREFINW